MHIIATICVSGRPSATDGGGNSGDATGHASGPTFPQNHASNGGKHPPLCEPMLHGASSDVNLSKRACVRPTHYLIICF
eukprot:371702-Amphidinium_carterae.1